MSASVCQTRLNINRATEDGFTFRLEISEARLGAVGLGAYSISLSVPGLKSQYWVVIKMRR